jgi:hypothetical protein
MRAAFCRGHLWFEGANGVKTLHAAPQLRYVTKALLSLRVVALLKKISRTSGALARRVLPSEPRPIRLATVHALGQLPSQYRPIRPVPQVRAPGMTTARSMLRSSFPVATRGDRAQIEKAAPKDGFLKSSLNQRLCLVAGIGFEPMTFRL